MVPPPPGGGDRLTGAAFATRSPVLARHGIAATSHPLAVQVALDVLRQGGTAVDAAIAANALMGVVEPTGCGIGGDLFALVWDPATHRLHGLNGSGRAPHGQTLDTLRTRLGHRDTLPLRGSLAVSVPGAVDGWFMLHERFGRLPWAALLAPAAAYAREGFPVTQAIAHDWHAGAADLLSARDDIEDLDNFAHTFLPDGRAPREGEIFRNPDLARTYDRLAAGGRDAFYHGPVADVIDAFMRRIGGPLRKDDFAAHHGEWTDPVSVNYRGFDVFELPPNGQGIAALQMLNILEGFDLAAMGPLSADVLHVQVEAKKLAFEDRARFYVDPAFASVPVAGLLSKAYAATRRARLRMDRAATDVGHGDPLPFGGDTVYLTVADDAGMMVSLIQSNYLGFGSGLVPDGLGFGLQNRGALFALEPAHPNVYVPGKRPFHTIIPAFVLREGVPFLSFGVMGGDMQPQGHAQVLVNLLDFGMNVQEAGDAARYRHTGSSQPTGTRLVDGGLLFLESGIGPDVRAELERRGHRIGQGRGGFGGYQAILWDAGRGVYQGASEMRKDGHAAGY